LGHGEYQDIPSEKEFFFVSWASKCIVCHFYIENWPCKVMDKHLKYLGKTTSRDTICENSCRDASFLGRKAENCCSSYFGLDITSIYYCGAHGIIEVYDVTD
jgi:hypothetical protein